MSSWYKESKNISRILYIARGVSGTGKSTLAHELGKDGVVYSSDDFFMQGNKYVFDINKLGLAHRWNYGRVNKALDEGISPVVVDNTNTTLKEILPYLELARRHGYEVKYAEPNWSPELKTPDGKWNFDFINKMQAKRKEDSGKEVPAEVVKRMIDRYQYKNPEETDEEFSERIISGGGFI